MSQPNILLIFTDMQRADTIHALGNPAIKTPNLDRLVHEGSSFLRAYTPSPVCVPARCSMHYGRYPHRSGCNDNHLPMPSDDTSYVQMLADAGYRTHGIGKMHFTPDPLALRGFQTRVTQEEIVQAPADDDYLTELHAKGYDYICDPHGVRGEMYYIPQVAQVPSSMHPTQWIGDKTVEFLRTEGRSEKPWMVMSSFIHPHPPLNPPNPWHKLYRHFDMPYPNIPEDCDDLLTRHNIVQNRYKYRDQGFDFRLVQGIKAAYYACVSFVDYQIGRILDALAEQEQLDNTLILFASDHGEHLGDYQCFGKRSMLDTAARVPFLIRHPASFAAGAKVSRPVSLVDIAPTFLQAAGIDTAGSGFDGVPLQKLLSGEAKRDAVVSQFSSGANGLYGLFTETEKYIYSAPDQKEYYLEATADAGESRNRAYLPGPSRKHCADLRQRLLRLHAEAGNAAAVEKDAAGTLSWKEYPRPEPFRGPDDGLIVQDHPWAKTEIPGYA